MLVQISPTLHNITIIDHHYPDDEGSGDYYYDDEYDTESDPNEYEDGITEPPLFITEESYKRPTAPPKTWTNDDIEIFETSIQIEEKFQTSHNAKTSNVSPADSFINQSSPSSVQSVILIIFSLIMCLL